MTPDGRVVTPVSNFAAMEPALGERDDAIKTEQAEQRGILPQWSPLLVSGMTGYPAAAGWEADLRDSALTR